MERVARLLGLRAFRCMTCYERFFSFSGPGRDHREASSGRSPRPEAKVRL